MLPPLEQIPEPWQSIHREAVEEQGEDWAEKYGEESLRAAMSVMGEPPLPQG